MSGKEFGKKNLRISKQQKEKLVDYMLKNLGFARAQFGGLNNGNHNSKEQWENLASMLNSLGGSGKTVEQWKKEPIIEIEILEEEYLPTPAKKSKTLIPELAKCSSKYKESLEEARKMTQKLIQKLEKIESQNELIFNKLNALEMAFTISSV